VTAPPGWPLAAAVDLTALGPLPASISLGAGQSTGIHPLPGHDGWLTKLYHKPADTDAAALLDWLVALPATMPAADRIRVVNTTSWPVAAVLDGGKTVGCVLPRAPAKFRAVRPPDDTERYLEVDWLARPDASFTRRGLTPPTWNERLRVSRDLVSAAVLFARYGLVYSDWSYSNAFYSPTDHSAYVIDVDGCGRHRMSNIFQPNWEDPHTPRSSPADTTTDRYRVALLVARLLTGERATVHVLHALADLPDPALTEILRDSLLSTTTAQRPAVATLLAVLDGRPYLRMPVDRMPLPPRPAVTAPPPRVPAATPAAAAAATAATAAAPSPVSAEPGEDSARPARWVTAAVLITLLVLITLAIALAPN
jgi:DNA-binding helix-hairpin-helix protein with protein kinase domain